MSKRIISLGFIAAAAFALSLGLASVAQAGPGAVCGDGVQEPPEQCDDGNTVGGDGCSADCIPEVCGDGILEPVTEECDDGGTVDGDGCASDCTCEPEVCGDGILGCTEECDDGNTVDGDGCSSTCMTEQVCGNGVVEPPEECDDGNTVSGDGCSATCMNEPYMPTKDDQKCVAAVNKAHSGVVKAVNKEGNKCVKNISKGKDLRTFAECASAADIGKASDKVTKNNDKKCRSKGVMAPPMFGWIDDPASVSTEAIAQTLAAHQGLLGNPANIVPKAMKDDAKCQQEVQKGMIKYLDTLAKASDKIKKTALKGKKVAQVMSSAELGTALAAASADAKVAKAAAKAATKAGKKCGATDIATVFPGACSASATVADLVTCGNQLAACAYCASLNNADALAIDCDTYAGTTCP